ncbi:NRBP [Acanthosepion pharaonis]|uniref:NRBP n=1 Tax=Acanthosepion pharaonis TaxID=158019 RepID=A0A812E454_ACAPH|nr:NRBP [Sepia pharaonis]
MMADVEAEIRPDLKTDSGDESDDLSEVLEESPCGRWQKRREEVEQRDVPGIDSAFLAMDTEEGMEVVWNEVQFSEKKNFKAQQEKIRQVFDNLIQLDHPNIVKFHKYWTDAAGEKPRVIFITEYMSSGSLKQFLKKTKKNNKTFPLKGHSKKKQAWKRWCTQILSALSYLHSCDPPIIHGNLTCDTIFIQHNGLVKIGSVAPDAIHHHVKTYREDLKNMHCIAPEYEGPGQVTTAVDIYSFGMCALEMAALEIQGNGEANVTPEAITNTLDSLEDSLQRAVLTEHHCSFFLLFPFTFFFFLFPFFFFLFSSFFFLFSFFFFLLLFPFFFFLFPFPFFLFPFPFFLFPFPFFFLFLFHFFFFLFHFFFFLFHFFFFLFHFFFFLFHFFFFLFHFFFFLFHFFFFLFHFFFFFFLFHFFFIFFSSFLSTSSFSFSPLFFFLLFFSSFLLPSLFLLFSSSFPSLLCLADFIQRCIERDPHKRPGSRELLFHAVLFEVHSLKLLAGYCFVKNSYILPGNMAEEAYLPKTDPSKVIAEINFKETGLVSWKFSQVISIELEKFLEDVRNGIYPLTAFALPHPPPSRPRAITPELAESVKSETPEPIDVETRMVTNMACQMKKTDENSNLNLTLLLRMDDKMNRQLQCEISLDDNASTLAEELVHYGFINELDKDKVASLIDQNLRPNNPNVTNGPMSPVTVTSG